MVTSFALVLKKVSSMDKAAPVRGRSYAAIVERIFLGKWKKGSLKVEFHRTDIERAASALGLDVPKNLGDVLYSFRFRRKLPVSVVNTAPDGFEWIIELDGASTYRFVLARLSRVRPQAALAVIEIPDSTPEIVLRYAQTDEQALLAKLRYNRLVDIFLGITTYSLQNHLRTSIGSTKGRTQIEIDELYVGIDADGVHYVVPVQAKGGSDQIGVVQTQQDMNFCQQRFPDLRCRPLAAQLLDSGAIALFELTLVDNELRVKQERHYALVDAAPYVVPGSSR